MATKFIVYIVLCTLIAVSQAADSCSATVSLIRRLEQDWQGTDEYNYTTFDMALMNTGSCALSMITIQLTLPSQSMISQIWNLQAVNESIGLYSLLNFGEYLSPGSTSNVAGFIMKFSSSASVTAVTFNTSCSHCGDSPTANPTFAPTSAPTPRPILPPASPELIQQLINAPSEVERQQLLQDQQFVFDFKNSALGVTRGAGGKTVATSRSNFPAVIGHGIAMTVGFIEPCGINLPHTHPRATEINFIVSGSFQAGLFQENGARFIGNVLEAGMATVFPQGAIHFEINLSCETAMFVAAFNNEDPGVQTTASSFFGLPSEVAAASLNITNIQTVEDLARFLPHNPAIAMRECMQRCYPNK